MHRDLKSACANRVRDTWFNKSVRRLTREAPLNVLSVTRPGTETTAERQTTSIPRYRVLLHNDDVNSMDHVVTTLMKVFRFEQQVCERIMMQAHNNGIALCTIEPFEQAELHRDQLISFSLIATIEPE